MMEHTEFSLEDITIREGTKGDYEGIARVLYESSIFHHNENPISFKNPGDFIQYKNLVLEYFAENGFTGYVTLHDTNVVGVLQYGKKQIPETWELYEITEVHVNDIAVKEAFQCKGIGKLLMDALFKWVDTQEGVERISLRVWAFNDNAQKFYEKLGFKVNYAEMHKRIDNE